MDQHIVRANSNFVYDPIISGYNELFWKTLAGTPAIASDKLRLTAVGATKALATLTSDATAPDDGDTVTIGETVYTFVAALSDPAEPFEVLIGASAATALDNLKSAINASAGAGTTYGTGTTAHPSVIATTNTDTTQVIQAILGGTVGNTIVTTEQSDHLSWGDTEMVGGADDGEAATIASYSFYHDLDIEFILNVPAAPAAGTSRSWGLRTPALGDRASIRFIIEDETGIKCSVYDDLGVNVDEITIPWDEDWTATDTRFGIRTHAARITFLINGAIVAKMDDVGHDQNVAPMRLPASVYVSNGAEAATPSDDLDITAIIFEQVGSLT